MIPFLIVPYLPLYSFISPVEGGRGALKEPVKIAERMVDISNCEKRLRAIAVKEKGKKSMDIWLTNIPASHQSAKGIIDEYRNLWGVEVFFKGEKSYWYLNISKA